MFKTILIVVLITMGALVIMAAVEKITTEITKESDSTSSLTLSKQGGLEISIYGEVEMGGTYLLPYNSTVQDAIEAASGITSNADPRCFNYSYVFEADASFYVAPLYDVGDTCTTAAIDKACINSDDKMTLLAKTSLSESQAQAIIDYRNDNGVFKRLEEIQNVKGIGSATWEKNKKYITLSV